MRLPRLGDISIIHSLSGDIVTEFGYDITVMRGYPDDPTKLDAPTVAVTSTRSDYPYREIGSQDKDNERHFSLMVFMRTNGERDDVMDYICSEYLSSNVKIKNYNLGYSSPPNIGLFDFEDISGRSLDPLVEGRIKHVGLITFTASLVQTGSL